jgi:hypothetical protein
MLPRHHDDSARAGKSGIAFGTGYPPGRSPLAIEKQAAAPWITLRDLVSGRPACHMNKKRRSTVARIQFQITYSNHLRHSCRSVAHPKLGLCDVSTTKSRFHPQAPTGPCGGEESYARRVIRLHPAQPMTLFAKPVVIQSEPNRNQIELKLAHPGRPKQRSASRLHFHDTGGRL